MRNIKTGIAVLLATLSGYLGIVQTPVFTVSACILSMKNTIKSSLKDAYSRILGTLLGGLIGYLFALFPDCNIFLAPLGVIIVIHLCQVFKISESASIASITFVSIIIGIGQNHPLIYSINRTFDTMVGVLIALCVNYILSRRKYIKHLCIEFSNAHNDCISIVSDMIDKNNYSKYDKLKKRFDSLQIYYNQLVDETNYSSGDYYLTDIHQYYNIYDQLVHHMHGLYILQKKHKNKDACIKNHIYEYHLDSISILLDDDLKINLNLSKVLYG